MRSTVHRVSRPRRDHFTILSNHGVRNRGLSRRARGLLWELCSVPEGWEVNHRRLTASATDSKHKLQTAVQELRTHGYLWIRRNADGTATWLVTDDPVVFPVEPHPDYRHQPHPDNPDDDSRDGKEEERSPFRTSKKKEGLEEEVELDMGIGDGEDLDAFVSEMSRLCSRLGVARWPLRQSVRSWCREVASETRYAALDLAEQARLCGEWWEPRVNGKKKQPHTTLRNWLRKAVEIADSGGGGRGEADTFAKEEAERWAGLRGS